MAVITIAAATSASTTSTATASIVTTSITATVNAVWMAILTKSVIDGLDAIIHRAGFTIAESWVHCQYQIQIAVATSYKIFGHAAPGSREYDLPPSLPENPPRPRARPARPPRSPPAAPPRASLGAVAGASRLPCRASGLSATFGGGAGSLSESWSLSLPVVEGQLECQGGRGS